MGHRSLPPHTRVVSVRSAPHPGSQARNQFPFPGHCPELLVVLKWANNHRLGGGSRAMLRVSTPSGHGLGQFPDQIGLNLKSAWRTGQP